ncbi:MAG TPA: lysylphosphatidylglycerol synthase transmembrane domain-containing protein [Thermoanaerobaculia bacterium]|nr:lysylphosphatidylglycerol synthase transmembrane domain-containing protein [Thermoanaerobaculia bacterium]
MNRAAEKPDTGARQKTKSILGRVAMIIALVGLTAAVASHFTDFGHFVTVLKRGDWKWITIGLVVHIVYFFTYAYLYKKAFAVVDVESRTLPLVALVFASIFVNAVIPSGGAGGAALFIDDARQRGQSGGRAAIGVVLVLLADLFTMIPIVVWGFAFLAKHHKLAGYDFLSAGCYVGYLALLTVMLVLAHRRQHLLERFLGWIRKVVNNLGAKFHKANVVSERWPKKTSDEFSKASGMIVERPWQVVALAVIATVAHLINIVGLWALIHAFGIAIPVSGLIAAFGMGIVFFIVSPVPQGVAVVEAVMTLVFTSLGISKQKAITITMIFRGVNFWLPLVVGIWFVWRLRHFGESAAESS